MAREFGDLLANPERRDPSAWTATARGHLAIVIVLDQFSRNIHRGTPEMYALDDEAVDLVLRGIEDGIDRALTPTERVFFYMPLMHTESIPLQRMCVRFFARLAHETPGEKWAGPQNNVGYAERHREIVERFGRFPHRNEILGRETTEEERLFLLGPGSSF